MNIRSYNFRFRVHVPPSPPLLTNLVSIGHWDHSEPIDNSVCKKVRCTRISIASLNVGLPFGTTMAGTVRGGKLRNSQTSRQRRKSRVGQKMILLGEFVFTGQRHYKNSFRESGCYSFII